MTPDRANTTVLVTGASGFVAIHCILQLLEQGYRVRGTLRSPGRETELRATLAKFVEAGDRLSFVVADLLDDAGWDEAVRGCAFVLHVASPFPLGEPQHEDDLIRPAVDGTRRVLRAAARTGVRRVVQTSSIAAIAFGHPREKRHFDETDWSNLQGSVAAYMKSKTLAERAAWEFIHSPENVNHMEMAAINPGLILGPLPDAHSCSSMELVYQLLGGRVPGVARMHFQAVDVRDVAAAHLLAMTNPAAAGQRFPLVGAHFWMKEAAVVLKKHFAARGYRIRTLEFPSTLVRIMAIFDRTVRLTVDSLDVETIVSSEHDRRVLGLELRGLEEMVVSMGESLIANGLL